MNAGGEVSWGGYGFTVYDPSHTTWNDVSGVYVFAGLDARQRWWYAKYIGQTKSFSGRLPSHEQWQAAAQQGATHIHARVVQDEYERIAIESTLIQSYQPPLNSRRS